jgi:hypothetical protein
MLDTPHRYGDALTLLGSLADGSGAAVFFDPQHHGCDLCQAAEAA